MSSLGGKENICLICGVLLNRISFINALLIQVYIIYFVKKSWQEVKATFDKKMTNNDIYF